MTIEKFNPTSQSDADRLIGIYQSSIERSEQKPEAALRCLLTDQRYDVLVARDDHGCIVGFAMNFYPHTRDFWLLEYMAVEKAQRSAGQGTALFQGAVEWASRRLPMAPGLLEVDVPPPDAPVDDDRVRRLRFYARHDCRGVIGLDYLLPLDAGGVPPPMMLLVIDPLARANWPAAMVCSWIETMYTEVYGQRPNDARISTMCAALGNPVVVTDRGLNT
ncbi:MAG: hypothetical protein C0511_05355 [Hyphomicrobium sp.]|nr:hypothetical protein [Hyphomicrobium sp.]